MKVFPFYLSIGMTYEQFWNMECTLTRDYSEAYRIKLEREKELANQNSWIQGMYIYDAIATVIHNTWCRQKNEKPVHYQEKPYVFGEEESEEEKLAKEKLKEEEAKAQSRVWLQNFVSAYGGTNE